MIKYTTTNKPILYIGNHRLVFTNVGKRYDDKWKWIFVTGENGNRETVSLNLKGLKVSIIPMKLRNKIIRVLKKYIQADDYIHKKNIETVQKELNIIKEDILDKVAWMEDMLL